MSAGCPVSPIVTWSFITAPLGICCSPECPGDDDEDQRAPGTTARNRQIEFLRDGVTVGTESPSPIRFTVAQYSAVADRWIFPLFTVVWLLVCGLAVGLPF